MSDSQSQQELRSLLVNLSHSLLQYTREGWPWTASSESDIKEQLDHLIEEQQQDITRLAALFTKRREHIHLGTYPDYTIHNYLALDQYLPLLQKNQQFLVHEIAKTVQSCREDKEAVGLLIELQTRAEKQLDQLQKLQSTLSTSDS